MHSPQAPEDNRALALQPTCDVDQLLCTSLSEGGWALVASLQKERIAAGRATAQSQRHLLETDQMCENNAEYGGKSLEVLSQEGEHVAGMKPQLRGRPSHGDVTHLHWSPDGACKTATHAVAAMANSLATQSLGKAMDKDWANRHRTIRHEDCPAIDVGKPPMA